jgi:SAM-dependent methyltransferase
LLAVYRANRMNASGPPRLFDRSLVRRHRARAIARVMPDFLGEVLAAEFADRLAGILRPFPRILVHRSYPGSLLASLARIRSDAHIIASDSVAHPRIDLVIDEEILPFAPASLDAIIWVLGLELVNDVAGALIQARQALRPDGLFLGAALAGDSLNELRASLIAAESEIGGGASPRVAPFADIRDWGMLLQRAGFALPVVDADRLTIRYDDALGLMKDLKALGLANPLLARRRGLTPPSLLAHASANYAEQFTDPDGRVRATFEIAYLTGWAPHESQQKPLRPGSAARRLADALNTEEHPLKREP